MKRKVGTGIEWAHVPGYARGETWNPTRGCLPISPGCKNCYAMACAGNPRLGGPGKPYEGLTVIRNGKPVWNGEGRLIPSMLAEPLRTRTPTSYFVDSMSDLFFEGFADEMIAACFGVMAATPQHLYLVLTKRAERMRAWFEWAATQTGDDRDTAAWMRLNEGLGGPGSHRLVADLAAPDRWPLPNVWIGVSVEDQQRADERIPHLLATPAAVRFLSVEPLLGPVDLTAFRGTCGDGDERVIEQAAGDPRELWACRSCQGTRYYQTDPYVVWCDACRGTGVGIDWVIVGGESGRGARPCDLAWARSIVEQCRVAGVAAFVKQLGADPFDSTDNPRGQPSWRLRDRKGGDMGEWPVDLRVRQFPEAPR